jgi:murein L,D-transpeptidase YcbB/YkuD
MEKRLEDMMRLSSVQQKVRIFQWLVVMLFVFTLPAVPARAEVSVEIFDIFDTIHQGVQPHVLGEGLHASDTLDLFYSNREYTPAWATYDDIKAVLAELAASHAEGLNPEDYHYSRLKSLEEKYFQSREESEKERLHAAFDVLLTDGVLLYARHMQEGKVDPRLVEATWNFARIDFDPDNTAQRVQAALDAGEVVERLHSFKPDGRFYTLMREQLARYRDLEQRYEFATVPTDKVLRVGEAHDNVLALRTQLTRLGYPVAEAQDPRLFDTELEAAVKDFQTLHTLDADGIVGKGSFRELNTPYSARVDQIRLNMDRLRWIQNDFAGDMVIVNIAGFELYYFVEEDLAWETGVMVGKIKHQTPLFRDDITYLELNPTWTVPRSIISRSLFPKFNGNPDYIVSANYKLYNSDGAEVDPHSLDWSQYSRNRFPFRVVQQPGPNNALGQVKFMFPNKYAIYLHDTPSRAMFSRTSRAFSSGCIRVRDPLHFADLLLEDVSGWDRARIDATIEARKRTVVKFGKPVQVMLMYWTASPTPDNRIQLHQDIYSKDAKSLTLLDQDPRWVTE